MNALRRLLVELSTALREHGEEHRALTVAGFVEAPEERVNEFLRSNELWGGSGSIADEAGAAGTRATRRGIEAVLIELGTEQLRVGISNARTASWVKTFVQWSAQGL